jgi:glucokinase
VSSEVIGIDLGGTKIATAALRDRRLGESLIQPTELDSTDGLIEQLAGMVDKVRSDDLAAVGIGVPSVVEFATGRVVSSINIPLANLPLREVLGERVGVPVFVDNDATVAALAEAHDDALSLVARNLIMFTLGTGVGGGIVLGGRIFRGATGGAGEFGHTVIGLDIDSSVPTPEGFPHRGSLEALAAGRALDHLSQAIAERSPDSELGRLHAAGKPVTGVEAVAAAQDGDEAATRAVHLWAERVGIGIANAINTFDPEEVVLGGGGSLAGDLLLEPARRVAHSYVHPGLGAHTTVRLARHGVRAGVLGAALLAAHELDGPEARS